MPENLRTREPLFNTTPIVLWVTLREKEPLFWAGFERHNNKWLDGMTTIQTKLQPIGTSKARSARWAQVEDAALMRTTL